MLKALWRERAAGRPTSQRDEILELGDLEVCWRRSARRKRTLSLKIDREGRVLAMTPMRTPKRELQGFLRSREAWIREQLAQHLQLETLRQEQKGKQLWIYGEPRPVETTLGRVNLIEQDAAALRVTSRSRLDHEVLERRLNRWLRGFAVEELSRRVDQLSAQTGLRGSGLQIRSYTARWGSCRHDGRIQLNWKLIKTPREVIDYVIVHELSHLRHFDHSREFWGLVAQNCPAYPEHRQWLKEHGRLLLGN